MLSPFILLIISVLAIATDLSLGAIIDNSNLPIKQTDTPQVLRDDQGSLSIDEAIQSTSWQNISSRKDTYPGFDYAAFWSRSSITSTSSTHDKWLLTLQSTRWEEIDWFIIRKTGEVERYSAGNARPGTPGIMPSPLPNIILSLAPGETVEIFLRCRSQARGSLEVHITSVHSPQGRNIENTYLLAFGALGTTCILGLLISLYGRHKGGIAYSISGGSTILLYAGVSGFAKSAEWPFSHFISMQGGNFFVELAILNTLLYLRAFFGLKNATGWAPLAWRILLIITLIALPLSLLVPYPIFFRLMNIHGTIHGLFSISVAVWAWRQGMSYAKFYVFVWPILWLALALEALCAEGLTPFAVYQDHIVTIGLVIFHFGVFLVLAERTRTKFREHEAALQNLLEKEQNLITELEHQVTTRTASLQEATAEAVKANQFKDLFLANIGHEIRTPLSALIGLSQIMVRKGESANLPIDFLRLLGKIHSGSSHLNLMLTNLMDVGTANQGKTPLMLGPVNLLTWSQSVKDILDPLAEARGVNLHWAENFTAPEIFHSDEVRLSQILINLVHNALKFSPEAGNVYVTITKEKHSLTLQILDQGPGLPDNPEQLFTAFSRHSTTLSNNEHGAGLGLHIVQTNLNLIHAKIHATNRPTGGASFTVTIPKYT